MYEIKNAKFSGPLDLLLQLIEKQKLDITEIALSEVTDQFLSYLDKLEQKKPEELADFLVVAARLLVLKSKALLPFLQNDDEDVDDLEKQLKMYKEFIEVSKVINQMILNNRFLYARSKPLVEQKVKFSPSHKLLADDLRTSILVVLKKLDPLVRLPRQIMEKTISLQQTIFNIKEFLAKQKKIGFKQMISQSKSRGEVIVHFLALLELVKRQHLCLKQSNNFTDIEIFLHK